jgi:peptidyl-prolyl cis-trans isomerase B (cyclophilin B)
MLTAATDAHRAAGLSAAVAHRKVQEAPAQCERSYGGTVATSKNQERDAREARDRLKLYNARQAVNSHRIKRRRRDNIIAGAGLLVIIALAATSQVFYFNGGPGTPEAEPTPTATETPAAGSNIGAIPDPATAEARTWTGDITLNDIQVGISLDGAAAPQATAALIGDIQSGFYVGKVCSRLVDSDGFKVLQCGAADTTGASDAEYSYGPIENAPADNVYPTGTLAIARQPSNAYGNGHQFFIVFGDTTIPTDDAGGYTVVGTVTSGLDAIQASIVSGGISEADGDGPPNVATTITAASIQ